MGGDVLYDNDGAKMYKDEIMQTICKVFQLIFKKIQPIENNQADQKLLFNVERYFSEGHPS